MNSTRIVKKSKDAIIHIIWNTRKGYKNSFNKLLLNIVVKYEYKYFSPNMNLEDSFYVQ